MRRSVPLAAICLGVVGFTVPTAYVYATRVHEQTIQQDRSIVTTVTLPKGFVCRAGDATATAASNVFVPVSSPACLVSSTPAPGSPIDMSYEWQDANGDWHPGTGDAFAVRWSNGQLQLLLQIYSMASSSPLPRDTTFRYQAIMLQSGKGGIENPGAPHITAPGSAAASTSLPCPHPPVDIIAHPLPNPTACPRQAR